MADDGRNHDELDEYADEPFDHQLRALAHDAEQASGPGWSAARVRRTGTARRRRRTVALIAASVAVLTLGGGAVYSTALRNTGEVPSPVSTPIVENAPTTPSATPLRTLTEANQLQVGDIGTQVEEQKVLITDPDLGRRVDKSSVCLTDGLRELAATTTLSRNFRISYPDEPTKASSDDPLAQQPSIYTQALQFADGAAARTAYETYQSWVDDCDTALKQQGFTRLGTPSRDWIDIRTGVAGTEGRFYELTYRRPGDDPSSGWFEAIGLTLAGDRMMVTISVLFGGDKDNITYEQFPKESDLPASPHEQFAFVTAAARRLVA